jgi:hypothetical protein
VTTIPTVIVGIKFYGAKAMEAVSLMRPGQAVLLRRAMHPKDPNAIECHFLGVFVGYVPRQANEPIATAFDAGKTPIAVITERGRIERGRVKAEPKITVSWD